MTSPAPVLPFAGKQILHQTGRFAQPPPPRLDMEGYAAFVAASLARTDYRKACRQKAIEERITKPFRLCARHGAGRVDR